jgi:hypothetical protein
MWLSLTGDKMSNGTSMNEREVRYQEDGDAWHTTIYNNGNTSHNDGKLGTQPVWLQTILDVAKVGGHFLKPLYEGPPLAILWFEIDKDFNLLEITFP